MFDICPLRNIISIGIKVGALACWRDLVKINYAQMETIKDWGSVNKPYVLDGNYDYLKAMMVVFLKCMGNKAWKTLIKGWKHPIITSKDGTTSLKP